MSSEYRRFHGYIYRLDVDHKGVFCKASKLVQGEWIPLGLTLRAMLLIDSDGASLSEDQIPASHVGAFSPE